MYRNTANTNVQNTQKYKNTEDGMVAGITSLVQSEVVKVESILLVKLSQLETKNEVSLFREKNFKHFRSEV